MAKVKYFYGTGRRKNSSARVRIYPATEGRYTVNKRELKEYLPSEIWSSEAIEPLLLTETLDKIEVRASVQGGGPTKKKKKKKKKKNQKNKWRQKQ